MTQARVPRILPEATASGPGRSSWLASAPPIGLALLAVLYAWISGMTLLGDALLILIKVAAALLAVAWAAAALPRRFGRGSRPRAVVAALAIFGFGAAGAVWMFPGVWIIPPVPLALPTLGIAHTIPAAYILAPALACVGGYVAYRRFSGFRRSAVAQRRDRIAADSPRGVVWVRKPRPAMLEHPRRTATLPEAADRTRRTADRPRHCARRGCRRGGRVGDKGDDRNDIRPGHSGCSVHAARHRRGRSGARHPLSRPRPQTRSGARARRRAGTAVGHIARAPHPLRIPATPVAERARDNRQRMTDPLRRAGDVRRHSVGSGIPAIDDAARLRGD